MQTAALLQKPMHLGEGFEDLYDFNYDSQDPSAGDSYTFTTGGNVDYDFPMNYGADIQPAIVDSNGNANTASGQPLISANTLSQIAINNPGREAQAVAQSLQVTNPDWTKQFKNTDELVRAAAGLFSTVKAVVTGQPIPRNTQSPYVYGPGQAPMQQTGLTTTHMLLIGGAALAAILLLRRK